jgi:glucose-1-phosphate thymidylyltransferase
MLANIRDILIIVNKGQLNQYKKILPNGNNLGIKITYLEQDKPRGLPDAFVIGEKFIRKDNVAMILGDNFFYGQNFSSSLLEASNKNCGATIFGYPVQDPTSYGVVEVDEKLNAISIEEKPINPRSNIAVTGLYFFDNEVIDIAKSLKPSERGELEITDVNKQYLKMNKLKVSMLGRGFTWLDSGTHDSLLEASHFVQTIEKNQGFKISCLEEIALSKKWIGTKEIEKNIEFYGSNNYGQYLKNLIS